MCESVSDRGGVVCRVCWQEKPAAKTNSPPVVDRRPRPPRQPITAPQQRGGNWTPANSCSYQFFSQSLAVLLFKCKIEHPKYFLVDRPSPPYPLQRRFSCYKSSPLIYINGRANKHGVVRLLVRPPLST